MRARNDCDADDQAYYMQDDVNDELRVLLQQRERRKDLEILKTPEIFITQNSKPREVEEWLRGKGFSDNIIKRLHTLSGEEIFALSPHTIESYFGQRESRRLISQIVLQKNFCEVSLWIYLSINYVLIFNIKYLFSTKPFDHRSYLPNWHVPVKRPINLMAILTKSSKIPDLNSSSLEKHNNASEALSFAINLFMCNIPSFMLKSVHTYIKKPDKKQYF